MDAEKRAGGSEPLVTDLEEEDAGRLNVGSCNSCNSEQHYGNDPELQYVTFPPPWGLSLRVFACVVVSTVLAILPTLQSWQAHSCLGVFLLVITLQLSVPELPGAVIVLAGLALLGVSTTLQDSGSGLWSGFSESVTWLVTLSVMISLAVTQTGLGRRVAYLLLARLGHSNLGIAYALAGVEMVLGPAVVSNTARGGGIVAPVVQSITDVVENPRNKLYYTMVAYHMNLVSSAAFLTGSSGNSLVRDSAKKVFALDFSWSTWFVAELPSAIFAFISLPLLLHLLIRPVALDESEDVRSLAAAELSRMGGWKLQEKLLIAVFVILLVLWATEDQTGLGTAGIALFGLVMLLSLRLLRLEDLLRASKAWSMLLFLGGMLSIINGLIDLHVVKWLAEALQEMLKDLSGIPAALVIALLYFFSMYASA